MSYITRTCAYPGCSEKMRVNCDDWDNKKFRSENISPWFCENHKPDAITCPFCKTQLAARRIMTEIDELPDINAALYDDAVAELYAQADHVHHLFTHEAENFDGCQSDYKSRV